MPASKNRPPSRFTWAGPKEPLRRAEFYRWLLPILGPHAFPYRPLGPVDWTLPPIPQRRGRRAAAPEAEVSPYFIPAMRHVALCYARAIQRVCKLAKDAREYSPAQILKWVADYFGLTLDTTALCLTDPSAAVPDVIKDVRGITIEQRSLEKHSRRLREFLAWSAARPVPSVMMYDFKSKTRIPAPPPRKRIHSATATEKGVIRAMLREYEHTYNLRHPKNA